MKGLPEGRKIGTLSEKSVHRMLKYHIEPDEAFHEVPLGQYIADIYNGEKIYEVQSRDFGRLKEKLDYFLDIAPVEIVHPVYAKRLLTYVEASSGEIVRERLSWKKESIYGMGRELLRLRPYLSDERLSFCFMVLSIRDYRILGEGLDGSRGAVKGDLVLQDIIAEVKLGKAEDFSLLVPAGLPEEFTALDYKQKTGVNIKDARYSIRLLSLMEHIKETGKKGRMKLYRLNSAVREDQELGNDRA